MGKLVRKFGGWCWPSLVAVAIAIVVVGLYDGLRNVQGRTAIAATPGFLALVGLPVGLAASLSLRALWSQWKFDVLIAKHQTQRETVPRLTAYGLYAIFSVSILVALSTLAANWAGVRMREAATAAIFTGIVVGVVSSALLAMLRPSAELLGQALQRIESRLNIPVFSLRNSLLIAVVLTTLLIGSYWFTTVAPNIGYLHVPELVYLILFVALVIAGHHRRLQRVPAVAGLAVTLLGCALTFSLYLRVTSPFVMLDVWAQSKLTAYSLSATHDLHKLREDIPSDRFKPRPLQDAPRGNIILVTIDTLRADYTPPYGGTTKMPNLAMLGETGVVFEWAFSPSNVTRRSLPALSTGLHPTRVQGRVRGWALQMDPRHVMISDRLQAGGYDTIAMFCCRSQIGPEHKLGLHWGFDEIHIRHKGDALIREVEGWLKDRVGNDDPFFMWIHFLEPHHNPSASEAHYRRQLTRSDEYLGRLWRTMERTNLEQRTTLIISSDHGEGLGEHGQDSHATDVYNSQIRVPLVVRGPGISPRRVSSPTGLVDLAPTILELAGFDPASPPMMDGVSLVPWLRGDTGAETPAFSFMIADRSIAHSARAVIEGQYKYIDGTNGDELYDLLADPKETKNLARERPEQVSKLKGILNQLPTKRPF